MNVNQIPVDENIHITGLCDSECRLVDTTFVVEITTKTESVLLLLFCETDKGKIVQISEKKDQTQFYSKKMNFILNELDDELTKKNNELDTDFKSLLDKCGIEIEQLSKIIKEYADIAA